MNLFMPTVLLNSVTNITSDLLKKLDVSLLLVDVDNTLAHSKSPKPFDGVVEWLDDIKKSGYKIVIVSNNFDDRVSKFSIVLNLPYVSLSLKPFPFGFNKAKKIFPDYKDKALVIGDQIFTDIMGANLLRMKSILLEPTQKDETRGMKIRRFFEKPIRAKIRKENEFLKDLEHKD